MKNPNKYLRIAHINALTGIGSPIWANKVPKDVVPIPKRYVLLTSQTRNETAKDKDGEEWSCTITLDLTSVLELGYSKPEILDDMEELIMTILATEIPVPNFIVKEVVLEDSRDLPPLDTQSQTIERRVMTYSYWLNNVD